MEQLSQITPEDLQQRLQASEAPLVLDVRSDSEWAAGHVDGAQHLMGGWVLERRAELPATDREVAVFCGGGYRSTVIASVLAREGYGRLLNVTGGMAAWKRAGLPTSRD